jgi:hypothetical protein
MCLIFSYTENQWALPKESTGITLWKLSIPRRINEHYPVENKHTKLINENYIAENEHNRKKRRALRRATRSLQNRINLNIKVGTEHSAGKRLFPWRSNGGWEGRGTKRAVPLQILKAVSSLRPKGRRFFIEKKKLCIPSERCVEPGSHG